ncbi:MAG TPA: hypothetical protein VFE65_05080 [Pseudonocardia sp.]|jgi:hypothetical protein|nr:hypothetical protein [Pseudonocardia sp.]
MRGSARPGSVLAAAALAGVAVLLWPNAPQAAAAQGSFTYTDAAGVSKTSANPPDNYCIKLNGSGEITNNTGTPVGFYETADCKTRVAAVDKGDSGKVPTYASVKFSKDNKPRSRENSDNDRGDSDRDYRDEPRRSNNRGKLGGLGGLGGL